MKKIFNTPLVLIIISMFSCTSENEQEHKGVEKQEIVEDTIEAKVEIEIDSLTIVKEDTIINVPKVQNDTTPVVGILKRIEESDFWGRVYLDLDVNGKYKSYDYWGEPNTEYMSSSSFKHVRKLVGKKILVKFRIEETLEENDLHIDNKTIHGKYGSVKTDEQKARSSKIEGTLLVHKYDKSGDLPSTYRIIDNSGDTISITAFVYDEHVALNGKKATVYYSHRTKYIAKSVVSLEKEFTKAIFIGIWKKEDSSNPIDPTSIEVKKEDGYKIKFSNDDYFVPANDSSNILKGHSNSGNFEIEVISEDPLIISYSDDGRGHFEPVKNERFAKEEEYDD